MTAAAIHERLRLAGLRNIPFTKSRPLGDVRCEQRGVVTLAQCPRTRAIGYSSKETAGCDCSSLPLCSDGIRWPQIVGLNDWTVATVT